MDSKERTPQEYVEALEEERRKIQMFQRELPLCLQLVTQAIESWKQQMGSKVTSMESPVLEEFIPLRPSSSSSGEEESLHKNDSGPGQERSEKKTDWLRSVQLWNQDSEPLPRGDLPRKPIAVNAKRVGGAFHPFHRDKLGRPPVPAAAAAAASSTTEITTGGVEEKEKEGQSQPQSNRKTRRCWSPELHRRFMNALDQLGGSHAATPKQIRELMKVDGLNNDEVKSHLQKFRLHNRPPATPAVQSSSSSSPQTAQFVVVGGIWLPPSEYAAAAQPIGAPLHGVYAPLASLPSELGSQKQQKNKKPQNRSPNGPLLSGGGCSQDDHSLADDVGTKSDSPTTSSSSFHSLC